MAIQKGTGFTNLNKVLKANQGNKLGQTVSGGIEQQTQGVKSQVKSAQEQFQEEAQKGRLDTGDAAAKRQEILNRFTPSTGASQVGTSNTAEQPVQSPVSDKEIQDFTKYRTGTYSGPKELKDASTLYGQAQQAESMGNLARSEGGRQELLRRFVGGNNYTQGQRQLDASLLGQQPGQLSQAAKKARGITGQVEQANTQAGNLAQEYAGRAKEFGEQTQQMVGETKAPLSTDLDTRLQQAQAAETTRLANLKAIQDALTGTGDNFKNLDKWTRSGLALQQAADQGILSQSDVNMLLGGNDKIGLLQRGANLGLDVNALINDRLTNQAAQNLSRTGIASDEDIARLNALDRLAGKQGTDLEFLQGQGKFAAGKTGFNVGSLEDYIAKTEAEKARSDKAYADRLAAEQARYMNQAMAAGQQAMGGYAGMAGAVANQTLNPMSWVDPGQMGQNANAYIQGAGNAQGGLTNAGVQGTASILEGLTKLNIGGQSLANTEGGRQLLKAIDLYSKAGNAGVQGLNAYTGGIGNATQELASGNIGKALTSYLKTPSNVVKNVTKGIKIKKPKIKFSDEDLKENIEYSPDDLQKFMDRIKPAAYDYKEEVQDSPIASKNRELGVMAQDLEKSELGKEAVHDTEMGKVVDYDNLEPKMLASIAALNKRLKELENKK